MDNLNDSSQLTNSLGHIRQLFRALSVHRDEADKGPWRTEFTQVIALIYPVLLQADQAGKRIDFSKGVGVNGKIQDVTALVSWVYARLPELAQDRVGAWPQNRLNRYVDAGVGFFPNGILFSAEFDDEVTFYVDDQRIYLNHHLQRSVDEAARHLL